MGTRTCVFVNFGGLITFYLLMDIQNDVTTILTMPLHKRHRINYKIRLFHFCFDLLCSVYMWLQRGHVVFCRYDLEQHIDELRPEQKSLSMSLGVLGGSCAAFG